jgi:hypothetical protein
LEFAAAQQDVQQQQAALRGWRSNSTFAQSENGTFKAAVVDSEMEKAMALDEAAERVLFQHSSFPLALSLPCHRAPCRLAHAILPHAFVVTVLPAC